MRRGVSLSWRTYLLVVLVLAAPLFLYGVIKPATGIRHCSAAGYSDDAYLAYCDAHNYGDYEHGALYFGVEPGVIEHLRQADILFLGNSRVQFALSSPVVRRFFAERGWRSYNLGFGYGENADFARALIRRYALRPAAVIINADPFFTVQDTAVAAPFLAAGDKTNLYILYATKRLAQTLHRVLCGLPGRERFACGEVPTIFRSRRDGDWDVRYYSEHGRYPVASAYDRIAGQAPDAVARARDFLRDTGLDPACTILTSVPSNFSTELVAERIAAANGLPLLKPQTEPLFTVDYSHLDTDSAARWSERLLAEAAPILEGCLQKKALAGVR